MTALTTVRRRIGGAVSVLRGQALSIPYKAAAVFKGRLKGWLPTGRGPNATLLGSLDMLRRRSRALARENVHGSAAVERFVSSAIGTGIVPIPQHPDPETRKRIQATFLKWTDECDANGTCDFYGLQSLVCRSETVDGEVFTRLRPRLPKDKLTVPLQLQVIESDFVPLDDHADGGETIRAGILFDAIGRRNAYRMYRDHPGEMFAGASATLSTVPAWQVIHTYRVKRPGQLRGEPRMTPAIVTLYDLDQYNEATLLRVKLANLLAFFIKKLDDGEVASTTLNEEDQEDGTGLASIEPGSVNYLDPNEEVQSIPPVTPGVNDTLFVKRFLRAVAASMGGLTYEQLSGDLEGVNLSSIRAGKKEAERWMEAYQHQVMVFNWCRPVWKAFVHAAVLMGIFDAKEYAAHPEWYTALWYPHRWVWTEPEKDLAEAVGKIRAGLSSRSGENGKIGEDSQAIDEQNAADNARADKLGLKYDSDGRNPQTAAQTGRATADSSADGPNKDPEENE